MRILIVDDEPPARARLRRLLAGMPGVQVVGEAGDGASALRALPALMPDVLLLDIQMPDIGGLDVAASLPDPAPLVVFVTAYDRYALPAFDAAALDYLLKPVEPERLARALQRARERMATRQAASGAPADPLAPAAAHTVVALAGVASAGATQLVIPDRGRVHLVPLAEIRWLEAADNYVVVHATGRAPLLRRTLVGLLADLGEGYLRCHRGAAVALAHVSQVRPGDSGDATLVLHGGDVVPCSRTYRAELMRRLGMQARV
ncbi:MAG: response regulator transcription factor [Burkholderiaceae bacterium]|nr:LytTR family DNA-binding domain-containing protein [Aquabacterium sp.]NUP87309.1 response regulator transcription factor [Burkholderiaceae bacterium]